MFPVVVFNPVLGDQEYVLAPETEIEAELPAHIACCVGVTTTVGTEFTVTATVALEVQLLLSVPTTV